VARKRAEEVGDLALEKEAWVSAVLLEWGTCGKMGYADGQQSAGVVRAARLGSAIPRVPTSPVSPEAVLLMTAAVRPEFTGGGLGRVLVQAAAKDLVRRGVRSLEAFGGLQYVQGACVLPAAHLLAVGFTTVRPHPRWPRLRLELKNTCRGGRTSRWPWSGSWAR
jgi:GNAT superfamily N-acetyltransferase